MTTPSTQKRFLSSSNDNNELVKLPFGMTES
eukprot:CAMPEP_0194045212 /NCGR_PEP_ID=MMETSP0009_2-20130614/16579_1 /TAXON_ID=210454 /ORGANISM="Grammatophora oceanica, Strain CCMP 410" /LENGTH=30 /DNA_ID= /DNA_START= /DNA_END= /DNA_ORIENTATION=